MKNHYIKEYITKYNLKTKTKNQVYVYLSEERLDYEKVKIADFLASMEVEYDSFTWDGLNLVVKSSSNDDVICLRDELSPYIKTLDFWITHVEQKSFEFQDDAWSINSRQRDNIEAIF